MEITKTKEYKSYVKELSKLYKLLNEEQRKQFDIYLIKEHELNRKFDDINMIKSIIPSLNKLKKKIKG